MVNPNNNRDKKKEHFYETNNGKLLIGIIILFLIAIAIYYISKCDKKDGMGADSATSDFNLGNTPGGFTSATSPPGRM
jgi:hypothetical protein